jgi:hypothetical protein
MSLIPCDLIRQAETHDGRLLRAVGPCASASSLHAVGEPRPRPRVGGSPAHCPWRAARRPTTHQVARAPARSATAAALATRRPGLSERLPLPELCTHSRCWGSVVSALDRRLGIRLGWGARAAPSRKRADAGGEPRGNGAQGLLRLLRFLTGPWGNRHGWGRRCGALRAQPRTWTTWAKPAHNPAAGTSQPRGSNTLHPLRAQPGSDVVRPSAAHRSGVLSVGFSPDPSRGHGTTPHPF